MRFRSLIDNFLVKWSWRLGLFVCLSLQVPYLDALYLESAVLTPCVDPWSLVVVKLSSRSLRLVRPRLSGNTIREVSIGPSYCQINDQIKLSIKWSTLVWGILPRVLSVWDLWPLPIWNVWVVYLKNSFWIIINVSVQLLWVPIHTICMEVIA